MFNLTIYFEDRFADFPEYFAKYQVIVVASLPCNIADNVDKMHGTGVFDSSVKVL